MELDEIIETEFCVHCGESATCVGAYEGMEKWSAACDTCCAHGAEDGHCEPVGRYAQRTIKALQAVLGDVVQEAKSAKARIADACLAHNAMERERDLALRDKEAALEGWRIDMARGERAEKAEAECAAAVKRADTAEWETRVGNGFHKVAVAERNLAWHQLAAAEARLAMIVTAIRSDLAALAQERAEEARQQENIADAVELQEQASGLREVNELLEKTLGSLEDKQSLRPLAEPEPITFARRAYAWRDEAERVLGDDEYDVDSYDESIEVYLGGEEPDPDLHQRLAAAGFKRAWIHRGNRNGARSCDVCNHDSAKCPAVELVKGHQ